MKNTKLNSFEDDVQMQHDKYLEFYTEQISSIAMTVHVDQEIREPSYYRQVVQGISNLSEGDQLTFNISSPGGRLDGLEVVLSAIDNTDAVTIANIAGQCHSAASILALRCNIIYVSPHASMLVHFISFGSAGASNHVLKQAEHTKKVSEKLFRDTYYGFLTEEEINKCIEDDYQLWLTSEDILERLTIRQEKYQELAEQEESEDEEYCGDCQECDNSCQDIPPPEYNPDDVAFKIPVGDNIGVAYKQVDNT